jgi:hypothetical protein
LVALAELDTRSCERLEGCDRGLELTVGRLEPIYRDSFSRHDLGTGELERVGERASVGLVG